ncbi:glucan synthase-like 4 [Artemisia annua]|uniref:Glucan synthase-like 4 n=1 Tax=Artemisia annua TaxID=35608 RepID=A0A2U1L5M5_ARTAN|nr:glucan synthase-like 4 [Artemisia annua]
MIQPLIFSCSCNQSPWIAGYISRVFCIILCKSQGSFVNSVSNVSDSQLNSVLQVIVARSTGSLECPTPIKVLYLVEPIDEMAIQSLQTYKEKKFVDVSKEDLELGRCHQLLGGGEVAEILLWRDETKSFVCFYGVISLFYWFCLCERTVVSSTALLLLLIVIELNEDQRKGERSLWAQCQAVADMKFTYVVSCQKYVTQKRTGDPRAQNVLRLMTEYPSLCVAYIDEVEEPSKDATKKVNDKIKLPGPAILGEGEKESLKVRIMLLSSHRAKACK